MLKRVAEDAKGSDRKTVFTAKRLTPERAAGDVAIARSDGGQLAKQKTAGSGHKRSRFRKATALKSKSDD